MLLHAARADTLCLATHLTASMMLPQDGPREPARSSAPLPRVQVGSPAAQTGTAGSAPSSIVAMSSPFRFTDDDVNAMIREAEAELATVRGSDGAGTSRSNGAGSPRSAAPPGRPTSVMQAGSPVTCYMTAACTHACVKPSVLQAQHVMDLLMIVYAHQQEQDCMMLSPRMIAQHVNLECVGCNWLCWQAFERKGAVGIRGSCRGGR